MRQRLKECLLNVFFPWDNLCCLCQRALVGTEHVVCCYCEAELQQCLLTPLERLSTHEPLEWCISAFAYENTARKLIHHLKYHSNTTVSLWLGWYMCAALLNAPGKPEWDAVVPVQLHPSKLQQRGYNQALLLAKEIAFCFHLTLRDDLLFRIRATASQTKRTATERFTAMQGVFHAGTGAAGLRILLVDDVLTTGATATACAKALLAAGATEVALITACQA